MRVAHISTYDIDGGAARAAFRLHESLLAAGQQSVMLTRIKNSQSDLVEAVPRRSDSNGYFADLIQKYYVDNNRTGLSSTWFSLGWPGEDLSKHPQIQQADVIHLHWVSGFISPASLRSLQGTGKPIVWSLHDQRPYTGGCHYSAGCNQFEKDCAVCPQLSSDDCRLPAANLADQSLSVSTTGVTVIAPSRWMADCARRSAVFARSRIEVIPYGIDVDRFPALPQSESRARLALPGDGFLFLFGVDNAREKRKGTRELFAVLEACGRDEAFRRAAIKQPASFLCFGDLDFTPNLPIPTRAFGRVRSDELLGFIYSAADLFLLPSLEDNLPNTVLESMSCGTPVGAFSTGGVPDMVVEGQTGFLAPTGDFQQFAELICRTANDVQRVRAMRQACRRSVVERFTYQHQAMACIALYEDLLKTKKAGSSNCVDRTSQKIEDRSQFLHLYPRLLKHIFDTAQVVLPSSNGQVLDQEQVARRTRFVRRIKRILKLAVRRSLPYNRLKPALESELLILERKAPLRLRLELFFKRLFRVL